MTDERTFDRIASDELKALEAKLTDLDGLEADLAADVLTLEFDDGQQFVVNSHRAARQIWVSANRSAWHFAFDEASTSWLDTRGGRELRALLAELVGARVGQPVDLG